MPEKPSLSSARIPSRDKHPPRSAPSRDTAGQFILEQHTAHRVQYDLRLEIGTQVRSWIFFRGLPTAPDDRCVAIEAGELPRREQRPLEGAIATPHHQPAGAVMVWDRGTFTVRGGNPPHAYQRGKMDLTLVGEKITGRWHLVRVPTRSTGRAAWVVTAAAGTRARRTLKRADRDRSVLTGRTIDEIVMAVPPRVGPGSEAA